MRRDELDQLESALRAVNPVPLASDLMESEEAAAVGILVGQYKQSEKFPTRLEPGPTRPVRPLGRPWTKPVVVFVAACLLALGTIGIVSMMRSDDLGFVDEPVPTTLPTPADGNPGEWIDYPILDTAIAVDGSLWATTDRSILRWNILTGETTAFTTEDGLPSMSVPNLQAGADGTIWVGNAGWMARYDEGTWTVVSAPAGSPGPLAVGPDGTVWTVTGNRSLARFDRSDWESFEVPMPDSSSTAIPWSASLDVSFDGTVWAGTHELKGVFSFDGTDWTHHTTGNGLPARVGSTVTAAPDGTVWAGSEQLNSNLGGGVARFDGTAWTLYTTEDGLHSMSAEIAVGTDGTVWAVHGAGVSRFDGTGWTAFPEIRGMSRGASVDATGKLWMPAAEAGVISVIGFDGVDITRLTVPLEESQENRTQPTVALPVRAWDPILTTVEARNSPTAATCLTGSGPDTPGTVNQDRPEPGWVGNSAAAFDQRRGRIMYVDLLGDTWAFDVCTNTWTNLHPEGARVGEATGLVYDVDSDRVIALGEHISVYDPNENSWTQGSSAGSFLDFWPAGGAVYDPISGLVITQHMGIVKAYDVDTDRWTAVGTLPEDPSMLVAYAPSLDRILYFAGLLDPRSGETTELAAESPSIAGGFGSVALATNGDTAYVTTHEREICRFETTTLEWTCFAPNPAAPYFVFAAMVFDSVNNRLVLINSVFGDWWVDATSDVWAIDVDTGEWLQLLEASD